MSQLKTTATPNNNGRFIDDDSLNGGGTPVDAAWLNAVQDKINAHQDALDNSSDLFVIYYKESSATYAQFRILNGIALDADDEVKITVFNGDIEISSESIIGASAEGDKVITVSGLNTSTNYTAQATLTKKIESNTKVIESNTVAFTTTDTTPFPAGYSAEFGADWWTSKSSTYTKRNTGTYTWTSLYTGRVSLHLYSAHQLNSDSNGTTVFGSVSFTGYGNHQVGGSYDHDERFETDVVEGSVITISIPYGSYKSGGIRLEPI